MDRRDFLTAGGCALAGTVWSSRPAFASIPGDNRLVIVLLRGGLDGLHALVPHSDPNFAQLRPRTLEAMTTAGGYTDLDGDFGLHHALSGLMPLYRRKELLLIPAASTVYRERSHFDGQNLLENGSGKPYGANNGWLNRAISSLNVDGSRLGLSIGPTVPLILQGDANVQTWSDSKLPDVDEDFMQRVTRAYKEDPLFAQALSDAQGAVQPDINMMGLNNRRDREFPLAARAAADLLAQESGPRIAVLELGGWDTHFDQERRLTVLFDSLAKGILELQTGLEQHWKHTIVAVVSEFGRTAAENANRGTDHGTGGLAMLVGGAVNGGRVAGNWPGLKKGDLWEGRDVRPMNHYESIFKSLAADHLSVSQRAIDTLVFPGNIDLKPASNILRNV